MLFQKKKPSKDKNNNSGYKRRVKTEKALGQAVNVQCVPIGHLVNPSCTPDMTSNQLIKYFCLVTHL